VLSTIFLGLRVVNDPRVTLQQPDIEDALKCLQEQIVQNYPVAME
jgi:hypothetical protein